VPGSGRAGIDELRTRRRRACAAEETYLSGFTRDLAAAGIVAEARLRHDPAPGAIINEALLHDVDLIAMATHGRGGLNRLLYGSVAAATLAAAPVPVLLVRAWLPEPPAIAFNPRPRLLVPLDGSVDSERALPLARELAATLGGELILLRAVAPAASTLRPFLVPDGDTDGTTYRYLQEVTEARTAEAWAYLRGLADGLPLGGPPIAIDVREGPPAATILAAKREHGAALVVMATGGQTGLRGVLTGSVAEAVLRGGTRPVLLLGPRLLAGSGSPVFVPGIPTRLAPVPA